MFNHAPDNYDCPFCKFSTKQETAYNKLNDIVFEDDLCLAFVSPRMWPNNLGNVIIVPKIHYEHIYDIPDDILGHLNVVSKKIAISMKKGYQCEGVSTRQHNEPGGMQDVFHFHLHVFPRRKDDKLYENTEKSFLPSQDEKDKWSTLLKRYL